MKIYIKILLPLVAMLGGTLQANSQANDWIFPPSTKIHFGVSTTVSSLSGGSAISGCGAPGTFPDQYGQVLSDGSSNGFAFIYKCGIYDVAGTSVGSGTGNLYENVFIVPGLCQTAFTLQWEILSTTPASNKLTLKELDISNASAVTQTSSTDLINDGFMHTGNAIAVARMENTGARKVYIADGTDLACYSFTSGGFLLSTSSIATLPGAVDVRTGMEVSPDGASLIFVSGPQVYMYDLVGSAGFTAIGSFTGGTIISGIEYVPYSASDRIYFSYHYYNGFTTTNGLDYVSLSAPTTNVDAISGVSAPTKYGYGYSEIELGKNGLLYFAFHNNYANHVAVSGDVGTLKSLDPSSGTLSTVLNGGTPVSVSSVIHNWGYIIQEQIDGEDYSTLMGTPANPSFTVTGLTSSGISSVPNIYICGGTLMLDATFSGTHDGYIVSLETGTVSTSGGVSTFTPHSTQPVSNTFTDYYPGANLSTDLIGVSTNSGCSAPWLATYRGPLRVTLEATTPCSHTLFTPTYSVVYNLVDPIDFLLSSPIDQAPDKSTPVTNSDICNSSSLTEPITGSTLRSGGDGAQDRNSVINYAGGDCGPKFSTFGIGNIMDRTLIPTCEYGWLGATTAGIFSPLASNYINPYGVNIGTITSFDIVVEQFNQSTFGLGLVPANVTGTPSNLVVNDLGITTNLSTGGIPTTPGGYVFNSHLAGGVPSNYFVSNYSTVAGGTKVFKVTYTAHTNSSTCGTVSAVSYFKILDDGFHGSPNGGQNWRIAGPSTGNFKAYPNPATDNLSLSWSNKGSEGQTEAIVTDVLGHTVLRQQHKETEDANMLSLNVSGLVPGVYHYSIIAAGNQQHGSFVKK